MVKLQSRLWFSVILLMGPFSNLSSYAGAITTGILEYDEWGKANNGVPFNSALWFRDGQPETHYLRTQQIFDPAGFKQKITGPSYITQIAFRNYSGPFSGIYPDFRIEMSTTSKAVDGLDVNYANNTGADATVVHEGALSLSSLGMPDDRSTPGPFDVVIQLQKPFLFDPSSGRNLLLDFTNLNSNVDAGAFEAVDKLGDAVSRIYSYPGNGNITTGTADSLGLNIQLTFSTVPEPATITIFSLMLVAAAMAGRGRRGSRTLSC